MRFDWLDYLKLAQGLKSNPVSPGLTEASYRSAVSRAYYAAFHAALDFALQEQYDPAGYDQHRQLRNYFRKHKSGDPVRTRLAKKLSDCCEQRRQADYDAQLRSAPQNHAVWAIGYAQEVLECLESLSHPNLKP